MRLCHAVCGIFTLSMACSSGLKVNPPGRPDGGGNAVTDGMVRDGIAAPDGPPPCTGTLVLGGLLPLAGTGAIPTSLAMADLNGDGKLDLVTANHADPDKGSGTEGDRAVGIGESTLGAGSRIAPARDRAG